MDVAIVGIGCRFPGGVRTPNEFWKLLRDGVDAITEMPADRFDLDALYDPDPRKAGKLNTRWGGFLDQVEEFDADFFGISPRKARRIDPQQRLLLEVVWEALEDAGQPPDRLAGSDAGIFVGISTHDYASIQLQPRNVDLIDAHAPAGSALCIAANRISYFLDLHGPSIAVDTACSSSLTALHLASQSLSRGECGVAITAGVNVMLLPQVTIGFSRAAMLSPDGRCKPFDANANGYVRSEGAGAVVLKPLQSALEDRDPIYAVIRATAINQDGRTPGISVPNVNAQKSLLLGALREAGLAPVDVQYVEAHGTGTAVGDPREAEAIGSVYSHGRPADTPCLVGSVKSNVGHMEAASGMAGLIKTALALKHRQIPPSLHFNQPSPDIPFSTLKLRVPTTLEEWLAPPGRAFAGVNSFGFGGANAHAILAESPSRAESGVVPDDETARVLTLTARAPKALRDLAHEYASLLADVNAPPVRDVCYTAALRRSHNDHRLAVVGSTAAELRQRLSAFAAGDDAGGAVTGRHVKRLKSKLAFVFSGMGPQWWGMGRQLLREEPIFRDAIEKCDGILREFADWSLIEELTQDEATSRVAEADRAHVANFALQLGLASLWRSWGVVPDAVVGHSSGEMAAACVAGALPVRDAVWLAYHRGRLQHAASGSGGMIAVGLSAEETADLIRGREDRVSLAANNSPTSVTLSGDMAALTEIGESLERQGHFWRWLPVRIPYHGPQMDGLRTELLQTLAGLESRPATIPVVSTATGSWDGGQPFDANYWWQNIRQPVLFAPAIDRLMDDGYRLFVELSPHPVLAPSILECFAECGTESAFVLSSLRRNEDERRTMLRTVATLYVHGLPVDWAAVLGTDGTHVRLPTYPWQRERHWFDPAPEHSLLPHHSAGTDSGHPLLGRRLRAARPTWETDLGDRRLAFLDDNVLAQRPTFAGAAYIETMLAAAGALQRPDRIVPVLEGVRFDRLLLLHNRDDRLIQCVVDEQTARVEIHGTTKESDASWIRHAVARLGQVRPNPIPASVDLRAVRSRCPTRLTVDDFYASVARQGQSYRGAFRSVAELWQGRGEALGRIALPEDVTLSTDGYRAHPALLDSAFQTFIAALDSERGLVLRDRGPLVLTGVERIVSHAPAGARFWCHARVEGVDGDTFEGHVDLIDEAGNILLTCERVRLKALHERSHDSDDILWQEIWERLPRPESTISDVAPSDIARDVRPLIDQFAAEVDFGDYEAVIEPALNAMAARLIRTALTQLGWSERDGDGQADLLGILPRHRQFFTRLEEITRTTDAQAQFDEAALAERADVGSAVRMVRESGARLDATLHGEEDARGWLVAGEASQDLEDFYARTPWGLLYNHALAEVVAATARRAGRKLRILEVGAGTGATTTAILNRVPDAVAEYVFTDVSPFFVKRARDQFPPSSILRFDVLDIEQAPAPSGQKFDVVVAADVVHATADVNVTLRNLRSLLKPGGLLVLLEITRRVPWLDLVFGQFDGWWRFADRQIRPDHPLLSTVAWRRVLEEAGFDDGVTLAVGQDGESTQAIFVAQAFTEVSGPPTSTLPKRRWLICADKSGFGRKVATTLRRRGDRCTLIRPSQRYRLRGRDRIDLDPTSVEHWRRLICELNEHDGSPVDLLHFWSLDAPPMEEVATSALMDFQRLSCGSVVSLMQATQGGHGIGEVWLATRGAQSAGADAGSTSPMQAPLWGLGRVLRNEQRARRCHLVDLGPDSGSDELDALLAEITAESDDYEQELVLRGPERYGRRLRSLSLSHTPAPVVTQKASPASSSFRLEIDSPGALDSLVLREIERPQLRKGEVSIQVRAAGLIDHDVLRALEPGKSNQHGYSLGIECAGIVTACAGANTFQPGDKVMALATGTLGSDVTARMEVVVPMPAQLSFAEAATVPAAFVTAHHALHQLARIAEGERVLIHSASGGVGLAAVQLCRRVGAVVFATAGSPEQRAYLESVGVEHVMDSRWPGFADEVLERTGGEGVDVVLNLLTGETRDKGLTLLRPSGRFIEMAVDDTLSDVLLPLSHLKKGLSFFTLGDDMPGDRPGDGTTLKAVVDELAAGTLEPLPHTDFDLGEAEHAFRLMEQADHIGKIVLTVQESSYPVAQRKPSVVRPDATYLITGGLGGFALAVADWLVRGGARHIVLMSRSGTPKEQDAAAFHALLHSDAEIDVMRGDVADVADVDRRASRDPNENASPQRDYPFRHDARRRLSRQARPESLSCGSCAKGGRSLEPAHAQP